MIFHIDDYCSVTNVMFSGVAHANVIHVCDYNMLTSSGYGFGTGVENMYYIVMHGYHADGNGRGNGI